MVAYKSTGSKRHTFRGWGLRVTRMAKESWQREGNACDTRVSTPVLVSPRVTVYVFKIFYFVFFFEVYNF